MRSTGPGRLLRVCSVAALILAVPHARAARAPGHPTAAEILNRTEEVRSPALDYAVDFSLHVVSPNSSWKERRARYTMIAHGKDRSLVLMREPKQFYPGTLLIHHGLYWLLLPRSTRPFQLSSRHVLNGDISNGDLARGNLLGNYEPALDGDETLGDEDCWRLNLTGVNSRALYSRIRAWVSKGDYRPIKFEYYGRTGELLKIAHYEDYREGEIGLRSMRFVVENKVRPGERTTLVFSDMRRFDSPIEAFNREGMQAFRDRALALKESESRQATAEELLPKEQP